MKPITASIFHIFILFITTNFAVAQTITYDKTPDEINKMDNKLEQFVHIIAGHYNNQYLLDTDKTKTSRQEVLIQQIWEERAGGYWACAIWFENNNMTSINVINYKQITQDTFKATIYSGVTIDEQFGSCLNPDICLKNISPKELLKTSSIEQNAALYVFGENIEDLTIRTVEAPIVSYTDGTDNIKYQRHNIQFAYDRLYLSIDLMDTQKDIISSSEQVYDRIHPEDPHYYTPLRQDENVKK